MFSMYLSEECSQNVLHKEAYKFHTLTLPPMCSKKDINTPLKSKGADITFC